MPLNRGQDRELTRRDFHWLASAALGGVVAGALGGCSDGDTAAKPTAKTDPPSASSAPKTGEKAGASTPVAAATAVALHACRGLNECKGQGKDQKNSCAGQGNCFTVKHECAGQNDCKNQGGCGGTNGFNDCKGKGGCGHFPIASEAIWKKARVAFESRMKQASKKVGPAPAATAS